MMKAGRKWIALLLALALILSDGGLQVWANGVTTNAVAESTQTEKLTDGETVIDADESGVKILSGAETAESEEAGQETASAVEVPVPENVAEETVTSDAEFAEITASEDATETAEIAAVKDTVDAAETENEAAEAVTETATVEADSMAAAEGLTWISINVYDYDEMEALRETCQSFTTASAGLQATDSVSEECVEEIEERLLTSFMSYEATVDLSDGNYTVAEFYSALYDLSRLDYRLFFVSPTWRFYYRADTGIVTSVVVVFLFEEDEVAAAMAELEATICEIVNSVDESWSDLEKVLYLNDYLVENCEYDLSYSVNSAYGALVGHSTMCMGYTMAFYTLAKRLGLVCGAIESSSLNHIWNYVCIDGSFYCVDTTWDDPTPDLPGRASHKYLLKSCEYFLSDEGGHYAEDWMYLGDHADEMSEDCLSDTSYDEYFWNDITRGIVNVDGNWYAMNGRELTEYYFDAEEGTFTSVRTLLTVDDTWYVWNGAGSYYRSSYSILTSYDGILYYSTPTSVCMYDLETESVVEIYELSEEEEAEGYIYGLLVTLDGTLEYCLSTSSKGSDVIGLYTLTELDTDEHTEIGSCTIEIDDSDLFYNGSLQLPDITITDSSRTLTEGVDYVAASFDNVNVGEKELCIVGIGDYTGKAEESFIILYEAPELTSIYNASNGVVFTFDTVDGVGRYRVYRRESTDDTWESIGYAPSSPCRDEDVESGKTYYYALQYYTEDYKTALSALSDTGSQICYLSPVSFSLSITSSGMKIAWSQVTGAGGYYIYRKADGESSSKLVKTITSGSTLSWTDTSVASGTTYTYYVNAYYGNDAGAQKSITLKYIGVCSVSYVCNTMDGLKVAWNEVNGADGYYIYRRNDDGTYSDTPTATVTGSTTTNWTDTSTLTGGKDYTYKVAAYYLFISNITLQGGTGKTRTCKYLKGGAVSSVVNTSTGPKVTWTKVSGANGYYIYRCVSGGDYVLAATVSGTSVVSWTDTSSLTSGKNYTYKIAPFFKNSSNQVTKGGAKTTKTIKYLTAGKISSLSNTSGGITVKWSKVTGATGYYIYRKASGASSYTLVKTITSVGTVSYTDTAVKSNNNVTYTYYVMPYFKSSAGVITKAGYTTKTTVRLVATSISSLTNSASRKMTVKWSRKSGVTGYQIQYSTSSSFASGNKTVTVTGASSVSKTISSLTKGKTYYVRIRTYKTVNGTTYYSAWSSVKSVKITK